MTGTTTKVLAPSEFQKIESGDHMQLAYELGRRAFQDNPDCDAIYLGGGSWLAEPVAERLEEEFGKPAHLQPDGAALGHPAPAQRLGTDQEPRAALGRSLSVDGGSL